MKSLKKWLILLIIISDILIYPISVLAATSTNVVVVATGIVAHPPEIFTVEYVTDTRVLASWNITGNADMVDLRFMLDAYPEHDTGASIYSGNSTSVLFDIDLTGSSIPFFRIFSRNKNTGIWEIIGSYAKGDFMTQSWTWAILLAFALGMTILPFFARILFGNIATKILSCVVMGAAWLAFFSFVNESYTTGFVFSLGTFWGIFLSFAIIGLIFNLLVAATGSSIDKSGNLTIKAKENRSDSEVAYSSYKDDLHKKLYPNSGKSNTLTVPKFRFKR